MKTRIISLAALLLFAASATSAFADAWIGSAVNVNGTWYSTKTLGWGVGEPSSFHGQDFGEIYSLTLGGLSLVYPESGDTQPETMTMGYKIDGVQREDITLTFAEYDGNNRKYQTGGKFFVTYPIDISNLSVGEHTIEVWFVCYINQNGTGDNLWDSNDSKNYVAKFWKKAPTPLANAEDIANAMIASNNVRIDVQLNGLTLYKDKCWNTLCLPFDLTTEKIEASPLAGAVINELSQSTVDEEGTLTLNFKEATAIKAGKPYIVKWESEADPIKNPVFTGVRLSTSEPGFTEGYYMFDGCFNPTEISGQNYLYLGAENTLYYPESSVEIGPFRAYFIAREASAGIKSIVLNFVDDNEETSIKTISETSDHSKFSDTYFTLDGRCLTTQPTSAGLYIVNGKKVVIK